MLLLRQVWGCFIAALRMYVSALTSSSISGLAEWDEAADDEGCLSPWTHTLSTHTSLRSRLYVAALHAF